jgi:nucleoside-diphosphate-sugar epimerase
MNNILVTGGLGHIGSALIRKLAPHHNVTVVDNLLTQRYCSLFSFNQPVKFIEGSFEDVSLDGIDTVIHLAAITNAAGSFGCKAEIEKVNVRDTQSFLKRCRDSGVGLFVFPSSTSVYGVAADEVFEDDAKYLNPQSPYAESKLAIEEFIEQELGDSCKYLILRLGTIFGPSPGMRFHTAVNKFCYQAALGHPLTVWSDNYEKMRPYLGINDACFAIQHLIKNDKYRNETYNTLTMNVRTKDVVEFLDRLVGVEVEMVDTPLLNQYSYTVNSTKIRSTGYYTQDNILDEIFKTLKLLSGLNK